jgi:tetratricopeptide (TPR) repeat protein
MNTALRGFTILAIITLSPGIGTEIQAQPLLMTTAQSQPEKLLKQGQEKAQRGDRQGAIADYTKAIQENPKLMEAYIQRGIAHHDLNDFNNAASDFSQALRIDPKNAVALYNRGEVRSDLGDVQGAIADLNQAIQLTLTTLRLTTTVLF